LSGVLDRREVTTAISVLHLVVKCRLGNRLEYSRNVFWDAGLENFSDYSLSWWPIKLFLLKEFECPWRMLQIVYFLFILRFEFTLSVVCGVLLCLFQYGFSCSLCLHYLLVQVFLFVWLT